MKYTRLIRIGLRQRAGRVQILWKETDSVHRIFDVGNLNNYSVNQEWHHLSLAFILESQTLKYIVIAHQSSWVIRNHYTFMYALKGKSTLLSFCYFTLSYTQSIIIPSIQVLISCQCEYKIEFLFIANNFLGIS